jgi:hypothetical protein
MSLLGFGRRPAMRFPLHDDAHSAPFSASEISTRLSSCASSKNTLMTPGKFLNFSEPPQYHALKASVR